MAWCGGPVWASNSASMPAKKQPRKDPVLNVGQVKLTAQRLQPRAALGYGERRLDDLTFEDHPRRVDDVELKLLFRAEVGVQAALAHADVVGETAEAEPPLRPSTEASRTAAPKIEACVCSPSERRCLRMGGFATLDKLARSCDLRSWHERAM